MTEKPQILTRVTDFLLYLIPQIAKFPKNQRYNLGERIETTMLNVFEKIVEMRTFKNLYSQITDFQNLVKAAKLAQRSKRFKNATAFFNLRLELESRGVFFKPLPDLCIPTLV